MSTGEINYSVVKAQDLAPSDLREMQAVQHAAFSRVLDRSPEEIDTLVDFEDFHRYCQSHWDPNSEVGLRYNANQHYSNARVAMARVGTWPVGFAYAANNVSGGGSPEGPQNNSFTARAIRAGKQLSVFKNYLWLREAAVEPEYQQQGIGSHLAKLALHGGWNLQPVSAYVWPDEIPFLQGVLEKVGFRATGEQPVYPYGEDRDEVRQVRMEASSVYKVSGLMQGYE